MNLASTPIAWLALVLFLPAFSHAPSLLAADGIPRWEQVLDEVLEHAEQERRAKATAQTSGHDQADHAGTMRSSGSRALQPAIREFARYFQGQGAQSYRASVSRLQRYRRMMTHVLREEGLPPELVWIGLVESGFSPAARSPKNALGIWQLIPETAKAFGLDVSQRDERTDPERSTRAAARYLKFLYGRFGDWALTLAAYNAGEGRVQDAIERAQQRDFWRLRASGLLPRETQAYVPAVLAAQLLGDGRVVGVGSSAHDHATEPAARIEFAPFSLSP